MERYAISAVTLAALLWAAAPTVARAAEDSGQKDTANQHRPRVALGVQVDTTPKGAKHEGAIIRRVAPKSAAAKAGLQEGDVITRADRHEVDDPADLVNALAGHRPGDLIDVRVWRDGQEKTLHVTLEARHIAHTAAADEEKEEEGRHAAGASEGQGQRAFLGVEAVPMDELTDRLRRRLDIQGDQGLVVFEVVPDSPAARAGLRHGDVITGVNGKDVDELNDLRQRLDQAGPGKEVKLDVRRGDQKKELRARLEESPVEFFGAGPEERTSRYGTTSSAEQGTASSEEERIDRLERRVERLQQRLSELERHQKQSQK
jgi:S1-C subfamily serine protease